MYAVVRLHVMSLSPSSQAVRPSQDAHFFIGRARAWNAGVVDSHGAPGLILTIVTSEGRHRDALRQAIPEREGVEEDGDNPVDLLACGHHGFCRVMPIETSVVVTQ
jgi:hypothetical protein